MIPPLYPVLTAVPSHPIKINSSGPPLSETSFKIPLDISSAIEESGEI